MDLENFNDNASSLKSNDSVGNFYRDANIQRVQIDCEKTQQDNDETQEGEFGLNGDGHWYRLVPSNQQDDEFESCHRVSRVHKSTPNILSRTLCFFFPQMFYIRGNML